MSAVWAVRNQQWRRHYLFRLCWLLLQPFGNVVGSSLDCVTARKRNKIEANWTIERKHRLSSLLHVSTVLSLSLSTVNIREILWPRIHSTQLHTVCIECANVKAGANFLYYSSSFLILVLHGVLLRWTAGRANKWKFKMSKGEMLLRERREQLVDIINSTTTWELLYIKET